MDFSIDLRDFLATRRHHTHLYDIDIEGNLEAAVVRELQYDAFGDNIIHVEFKRVIRGQKTDAEVPVEFVGHPKSGQLNHLMTTIHISCLPSEIPDSIEVKISELGEGDAIHASDIKLPEGMELITDGTDLVAAISSVKAAAEDIQEEDEDLGDITGTTPAPDGEDA
jgi:large subunit ribosomal protein L25